MPRGSGWALVGLTTATAAGVGATIAAAVLSPFAPASTATPAPDAALPVQMQPYADTHQVQVVLQEGAVRALVAPAGGVVTALTCSVGVPLRSGASVVAIDGVSRLGFATRVPLWRDLTPGLQGADVDAVHAELARLHHPATSDGPQFGVASAAAVAAVLHAAGVPVPAGGRLPRDMVVWLPADGLAPTACPVAIGAQTSPGQALATLAPPVTGAHVASMPTLVSGSHQLDVEGHTFTLNPTGQITARSDLDALSATASASDPTATTTGISATVHLAQPVQVAVVPPSAVLDDGQHQCVYDQGRPHRVQVLGSQLGQSYVTFPDAAVTRVAITPPRAGSCS